MKIIADGGSTKTDWALVSEGKVVERFSTSGANPVVMGLEHFKGVMQAELLPQIRSVEVNEIEFYGAGCTDEMSPGVRDIFLEAVPSATRIVVESDLLGACRAICGNDEGIVAILGTGSNSCLYDGRSIVANTPPLGFILGDEGSGAALGKLFLNALLKKRLPQSVWKAFEKEFSLSYADILRRVYQERNSNVFLASFAPFVCSWSSEETVNELIKENFRKFFSNNIRQYGRQDLSVNCVGSIAHHFADCLKQAAEAEGVHLGQVLRSPIDKLCEASR